MSVTIRSNLIDNWLNDGDPFNKISLIEGRVVRSKEGRTTKRVTISDKGFYIKLHKGVGWKEVFKNLLQLRLPVVGASNEWNAINRLHQLGLSTLTAVAYGMRGWNPASKTSFIITEELTGTLSLAKFAEDWPQNPPDYLLKTSIIDQLADITRTIHKDGINHRDLYICHFLLDIKNGVDQLSPDNLRLYLVDLHRAQIRKKVPERWQVKDLASIYFSAMDTGLTKKDVYRFLRHYYQRPLREILETEKDVLTKITSRVIRLYKRDFDRSPSTPF